MQDSKAPRNTQLEVLFNRAASQHEKGNFKSAFRLCLGPAKGGNLRAQLLLGYFYSDGIGVKPNLDLALNWTRRAYRQAMVENWAALGAAAANNIGLIYRDAGKTSQAIAWLKRAVKQCDDGDANLEIAKIYLDKNDWTKAIHHLRDTLKADRRMLAPWTTEEAKRLLKKFAVANKLKDPGLILGR